MDQVKFIKKVNDAIIWPGATIASGFLVLVVLVKSRFNLDALPYMFEDTVYVRKELIYHGAFISTVVNILLYRSLLNFILL